MTIAKNTKRAKEILHNAHDIKCFSLANNFSGQPLPKECNVWGGPIVNGRYRDLLAVSPQEYLTHELNAYHCKLTQDSEGRYSIYVHSNLWYEFQA